MGRRRTFLDPVFYRGWNWRCVDCWINTRTGKQGDEEDDGGLEVTENSEIYCVGDEQWADAGMDEMDGCLCISCLEKRLGRKLKPDDFVDDHPLNEIPGTPRLMNRRERIK